MLFVLFIVLLPIFEWLGDHEFEIVTVCAVIITSIVIGFVRAGFKRKS